MLKARKKKDRICYYFADKIRETCISNILSYLKSRPYKFRYLTVAMILWFILFPFLEGQDFRLIILNILTSAIVLFGILAVSYGKRTVIIGLALGLPWLILSWIDILILPLPQLVMFVSNVFLILFFCFHSNRYTVIHNEKENKK